MAGLLLSSAWISLYADHADDALIDKNPCQKSMRR